MIFTMDDGTMAWVELLAGIYLGAWNEFITADDFKSRLVLKAPLIPLAGALIADALSRLGFI